MALRTKLFSTIFLLVLFLFVLEDASGCRSGQRCLYSKAASPADIQTRKVLAVLKRGVRGLTSARELRMVPSGPDPLHHNGGSPQKPRTP